MDRMHEFRARLDALRAEAGEPSYGDLAKCAARLPDRSLAKQTVSDLLTRNGTPRWSTVETFVLACREHARARRLSVPADRFDLTRWRAEFDATRGTPARPEYGPLREPYRDPDTAQTPARLLRAEYGVVPFQARDELTVLVEWCRRIAGGDRTGLAVLHGPGGAGKTRLALELAYRMRADGWCAGVLPRRADVGWLSTTTAPALVVIDYADGRVDDVAATCAALRGRSTPAVVLLTARAGEGQWLTDLTAVLDEDRHPSHREDIVLPDSHPDGHDLYVRAFRASGGGTGVPPELPAPDPGWTTLDLVLQGWLAASGGDRLPDTRTTLYDEVLRHEENYWCTVHAESAGIPRPERALLRRAAVAVSLVAPSRNATGDVLRALPELADDPAERRHVRRTLWTCLSPAIGDGLAVRPDPVGDHLLLRELTHDPDLLHAILSGGGEDLVTRAVATLDRAGQHDPGTAVDLITAVLEADPGRWPSVFTAAVRRAGPARTAIERLAERQDSPLPLDELAAALPPSPLYVYRLALIVDRQRLARARSRDADSATMAELLLRMWIRTRNVGDHHGALAAIDEAVGLNRELAGADPVHEPGLAGSLNNLGLSLLDLARPDEGLVAAREAVNRYRRLAAADPAAHLSDLANALTNLAILAEKLDLDDEALATALEVVEHSRALVRRDAARYRVNLASALSNLSPRLTRRGRLEEAVLLAEEAVEHYGTLTDTDPVTHLCDLGRSLHVFAEALSRSGRDEQALAAAEGAVACYRYLSDDNPVAYGTEFAVVLNQRGQLMTHLRHDDAFAAVQEAVAYQRRYAAEGSAAGARALAGSLHSLAALLDEQGHWDESAVAMREVIEIHRGTSGGDPARRAISLHNLVVILGKLRRLDDAMFAAEESTDLFRALAAEDPAAGAGYLTMSLNSLSWLHHCRGDTHAATVIAGEGVAFCRHRLTGDPGDRTNLALALQNLSVILRPGDSDGALRAALEGAELLRALAAEDWATYLPHLAQAAHDLSLTTARAGLPEDALRTGREAVDSFEELDSGTGRYTSQLASALSDLADRLAAVGRVEEALAADQRAVELGRTLAGAGEPVGHLSDLAGWLRTLGARLTALRQPLPAVAVYDEAVEVCRELVARDAVAFLPLLSAALRDHGGTLAGLNLIEDAETSLREAVAIDRELAAPHPGAALARSLGDLGRVLASTGKDAEARVVFDESVELLRSRAGEISGSGPAERIGSLIDLFSQLAYLELWDQALPVGREAMECGRRLVAANPDSYLPMLATTLNNAGLALMACGRQDEALNHAEEAVRHCRLLADRDPATHLLPLVTALTNLSIWHLPADRSRVLAIWRTTVSTMSDDIVRAALRARLARFLTKVGLLDQSADELRHAATEANRPQPGTATAVLHDARREVRYAAFDLDLGGQELPGWVTHPIDQAHLAVITTIGQATTWPQMREALTAHHHVLTQPEFAATLDTLRMFNPGDSLMDTVTLIHNEISNDDLEVVLTRQQQLQLLIGWFNAPDTVRSADYYREHHDVLHDSRALLDRITDDVAHRHRAILDLGCTLPVDQVCAIVADPTSAEDATMDAIERGDLTRMATTYTAVPGLRHRPMTTALVDAVTLLADDRIDEARKSALEIAAHGTPLVRRAHAARLRMLSTHRPDLRTVTDLVEIIEQR